MCQKGMWPFWVLLACGGRASDETRPSARAPTPEPGGGAEQPTPGPTPRAGVGARQPGPGGTSQSGTDAEPQRPIKGCEPGTARCNGSLLEVCSSLGSWLGAQECAPESC